jgi:hypothetical protein
VPIEVVAEPSDAHNVVGELKPSVFFARLCHDGKSEDVDEFSSL